MVIVKWIAATILATLAISYLACGCKILEPKDEGSGAFPLYENHADPEGGNA